MLAPAFPPAINAAEIKLTAGVAPEAKDPSDDKPRDTLWGSVRALPCGHPRSLGPIPKLLGTLCQPRCGAHWSGRCCLVTNGREHRTDPSPTLYAMILRLLRAVLHARKYRPIDSTLPHWTDSRAKADIAPLHRTTSLGRN